MTSILEKNYNNRPYFDVICRNYSINDNMNQSHETPLTLEKVMREKSHQNQQICIVNTYKPRGLCHLPLPPLRE